MKFNSLTSAALLGTAVLLASCGGGGGDAPAPQASLQLSGTAATGLALASAAVEVKCATGGGTATTAADGTYTLAIPQGALPCMVQVTGSGAASAIVLHSVAQAGSTDAATAVTSAKANVTPLTELVVAQVVAGLPADFFVNFGSGSSAVLTQDKITAAATAVASALKDAGIDLGGIDPLQAPLVAATGTSTGNAYDKLLDDLAKKVTADALPLLVTQVANAAATGSTLTDAMAAVQGGGLPGCPYVLSGNYRAIDYFGRMTLRPINFAAKTFGAGDGVNQMTIVQDGTNPCEFTATLNLNGQVGEWQVAFGPGGVGIYRARIAAPTASAGTPGLIFPVQSHGYAEVAGTWTSLVTGYFPDQGGIEHNFGQMVLGGDRSAKECDYAQTTDWSCQPDTTTQTVADRADGGFDLVEGTTTVANVYGYRAPNGVLNLFGTTNASGSADSAVEQTSIILLKTQPLTLPAVGSVDRYSEELMLFSNGSHTTTGVTSTEATIAAVDATTGTLQRQRADLTAADTWHVNQPISGFRQRDANPTANRSAAYGTALPGLGINVTTNVATATGRWIDYTVTRP